MILKKPKNRKFDYQPRYYKPETDKSEKRKRKLGFRNNFNNSTRKRSPIIFVLLLIIILYLIIKYQDLIK
ncbi:MAG: hypothetical protein IPM32_14650 [Ignavibacteriae bacterium]|nr:hypothetical protein [Ignavibacteriota bacterium]